MRPLPVRSLRAGGGGGGSTEGASGGVVVVEMLEKGRLGEAARPERERLDGALGRMVAADGGGGGGALTA